MVDVARPGERIPIASDHAGFELKERLRVVLGELGYEVEDIGTHSTASTEQSATECGPAHRAAS